MFVATGKEKAIGFFSYHQPWNRVFLPGAFQKELDRNSDLVLP